MYLKILAYGSVLEILEKSGGQIPAFAVLVLSVLDSDIKLRNKVRDYGR